MDGDQKLRQQLTLLLKEEPRASDLMWCIFLSAAESYKFDSLLRPYPKSFLDEVGDKDIEKLRNVAQSIPNVLEILPKIEDGSLSEDQKSLLQFVLLQPRPFRLRAVHSAKFQGVIELVQKLSSIRAPLPHHIFEVDQSSRASCAKFDALAKEYGTRFAYHGSRLENFYSILHHGLQVSLNKVAAFGPGVYLSGDLSVSMTYSPMGLSWAGSMFGEKLSAIAVCEMIDHPDVKCQDEKLSSRKYAEDSRVNEVPHKYFIVQNSDLVRVRYLLFYTQPARKQGTISWGFHATVILVIILGAILFNNFIK